MRKLKNLQLLKFLKNSQSLPREKISKATCDTEYSERNKNSDENFASFIAALFLLNCFSPGSLNFLLWSCRRCRCCCWCGCFCSSSGCPLRASCRCYFQTEKREDHSRIPKLGTIIVFFLPRVFCNNRVSTGLCFISFGFFCTSVLCSGHTFFCTTS